MECRDLEENRSVGALAREALCVLLVLLCRLVSILPDSPWPDKHSIRLGGLFGTFKSLFLFFSFPSFSLVVHYISILFS